MTTKKQEPETTENASAAKPLQHLEAKRAGNLRANLLKRKEQQRARQTGQTATGQDDNQT